MAIRTHPRGLLFIFTATLAACDYANAHDYANTFTYRGSGTTQYVAGRGCSGGCVTASLDGCKAMCTARAEPECRAFNWRDDPKEGKQCCLKHCSDPSDYYVLGPSTGTSTGWSVYIRQTFGGTSYSYAQIGTRTKCAKDSKRPNCSNGNGSCNFQSANGCFAECLAADGCTHFSFSLQGSGAHEDALGLCILCTEIPSEFFTNHADKHFPDAMVYEMITTIVESTTTLAPAIAGDACATSKDCTDTQCKNKRCCKADIDRACTSCDDAGFCDSFDKELLPNSGSDAAGTTDNSNLDNDADTDGSTSGGGLDTGTIIGIVVSVVIAGIGGIVMFMKNRKDSQTTEMIMQKMDNLEAQTKQNPAFQSA